MNFDAIAKAIAHREPEKQEPGQVEFDYKHPRAQALIANAARNRIYIDLIWRILEDPHQDFTASDTEYWDAIHDAVHAAVTKQAEKQEQQEQQELTDEQIDSACLSYRHDFGLLSVSEQDYIRFQAKEWAAALAKVRSE
jgi:hypothetical protein